MRNIYYVICYYATAVAFGGLQAKLATANEASCVDGENVICSRKDPGI